MRCRWERYSKHFRASDKTVFPLQEVEEALNEEAKILRLADGGVLLESLRTRRLLETAELALKVRIVNTLESRFVIMISSVIRV